nr:LacI family DNA-binding transcriptional regulator [Aestuariibacter sp. A3R04]
MLSTYFPTTYEFSELNRLFNLQACIFFVLHLKITLDFLPGMGNATEQNVMRYISLSFLLFEEILTTAGAQAETEKQKMSNIREVADMAGVSVATVSRALQHPERVSPKTRDKVMTAVKEVGYKPNLMAVKFRSGKTHNLVVLVPTIATVFFARVISGMQEAAAELGYALLLGNTLGRDDIEAGYAKMVQTSQADGLIQLRAKNPFDHEDIEHGVLLPMVNACEVLDSSLFPTVVLDNRAAARAMTSHLLSLGHTRIALIKGPAESPLTRDRLSGYRDALENAGLEFDPHLLFPGDFTLQAGLAASQRILALDDRPTAVFCENDETAIGAVQGFKAAGLSIPDDISVAGFDNIDFAAYCDPPLTTIAQPAEAFGRTAVNLLIDVLEGKIKKAPRVIMPFELVLRKSTGKAPSAPIQAIQARCESSVDTTQIKSGENHV